MSKITGIEYNVYAKTEVHNVGNKEEKDEGAYEKHLCWQERLCCLGLDKQR